jgi:hypothetical protein
MKTLRLSLFWLMILMTIFSFAQSNLVERGSRTLSTLTRKAPYLIYTGNNTEIQILWQLTSTDTCTIEWGTDTLYILGSVETTEYGNSHQHTYTITNLEPGTKYYYRVTGNGEIHTGSFRSAPPDNANAIKFMAYGDTRSHPNIHDQVAAAMLATFNGNEDFQSIILLTGDLVNNGNSESDWDNQFFNPSYPNIQAMLANVPCQAAMGNHEGSGQLFVKYFPYPFTGGRYWSYDYGPAHFVVVDQYTSYSPGSAQLQWIENDLASTTKPWKFLYLHEPAWSAGGHGNNTGVQNYIQPLCEQYGVSILFAGHNHYYARAVVNDVQHVTTGGGGAPLYSPNNNYPNVVATSMAYHYCKVEIDSSSLQFTAVKPDAAVIDEFTVNIVGIESANADMSPGEFALYPAYPNPFNPAATIRYDLAEASQVVLNIYNILGREVRTLVNEKQTAGEKSVVWDSRDSAGKVVSSGVYIYRIQAGDYVQSRKMVLLR